MIKDVSAFLTLCFLVLASCSSAPSTISQKNPDNPPIDTPKQNEGDDPEKKEPTFFENRTFDVTKGINIALSGDSDVKITIPSDIFAENTDNTSTNTVHVSNKEEKQTFSYGDHYSEEKQEAQIKTQLENLDSVSVIVETYDDFVESKIDGITNSQDPEKNPKDECLPDFEILRFHVPKRICVGENFKKEIHVFVKNSGCADANVENYETIKQINYSWFVATNKSPPPLPHQPAYGLGSRDREIRFGSYAFKKLKQGQIEEVTIASMSRKLRIPFGAPPGNYYLGFVIDSLNSHQESNENNNIAYAPVNIEECKPIENDKECVLPDVAISDFKAPQTACPGENIHDQIEAQYVNKGCSSLSSNLEISLHLSQDKNISPKEDIRLDSPHKLPTRISLHHKIGEKADVYFVDEVIPENTAPGKYFLGIVADAPGKIRDADRKNNIAYQAIEIKPAASCPP